MTILINFFIVVDVVCSILLVLIILMQRPKSEGLGTAFGGGVTENLFGAGAGNILTKITTWLGIIFFVTTISLAYLYSHRSQTSHLREKLKNLPTTHAAPKNENPSATTPSNPAPSNKPAPPPSPSPPQKSQSK